MDPRRGPGVRRSPSRWQQSTACHGHFALHDVSARGCSAFRSAAHSQWSASIPPSKERASESDRLRHSSASRPSGGHCGYPIGAPYVSCDQARPTLFAGGLWQQVSRLVQSSESAALLCARVAQGHCSPTSRAGRDRSRDHGHHRPPVARRSRTVHACGAEIAACGFRHVEAQTMNTRRPTHTLGGTTRRERYGISNAKIRRGAP